MLVNILIKEPYTIYSLKLHSKFIYTEWIAVHIRRISNLIGLPLLSEHRSYHAVFH